jgi:P27 family predicted phage terminase small subunit
MPARLDPPDWYNEARRAIWDDTIRRLTDSGGLFRADPRVIETYVAAYITHTEASQHAAVTNVIITRDGKDIENPVLAVQRRAAAELARTSKTLGLGSSPMQALAGPAPMRDEPRKWCEEHGGRWECSRNRKDGTPCHSPHPIAGTGTCRMHAGMTAAQARAKGQARMAAMYATPLDVGPGEALLTEVQWAAGHLADLRAKVAELAQAEGPDGEPGSGLWYGLTREVRARTADGEATVEREYKPGPHVILATYERAQDRLGRLAAAAHAAGAQEQAISAVRALGAGVFQLFDQVFRALELSEAQWARVPEVVPPVLAAWDPDAPLILEPGRPG